MKKTIVFACLLVGAFSLPAFSQQGAGRSAALADSAVDDRIKALEERIIALEGQVRQLKVQQTAQAAPTPAGTSATLTTTPTSAPAVQAQAPEAAGTSAPLPVYGGASAAAKALNPD